MGQSLSVSHVLTLHLSDEQGNNHAALFTFFVLTIRFLHSAMQKMHGGGMRRTDENAPASSGQTTSRPDDLLTRAQVAEFLDVSPSTVKRLEAAGRLKARTTPGAKPQLYARADVQRLAAELRGDDVDAADERQARRDVVALATAHAAKMQELAAASARDREASIERFAALLEGLLSTATSSNAQLATALEAAQKESLTAIVAWRESFHADAVRDADAARSKANRDLAREALQSLRPLVPTIGAAIAKGAALPVAERAHQADVLPQVMASLSDDAKAAVRAVLTDEQRDCLDTIEAVSAANKAVPTALEHIATTLTQEQTIRLAGLVPAESVAALQTLFNDVMAKRQARPVATPATKNEAA